MDNLICCKNVCSFDAIRAVFNIFDLWEGRPADIGFEAFGKEALPHSAALKLEIVSGDAVDHFYYDGSASSYLSFRIYSRAVCNDIVSSQDVANTLYAIADHLLSFDLPYEFGDVILRCFELTKLPFRSFAGNDGSEEFCVEFGLHYFTERNGKD